MTVEIDVAVFFFQAEDGIRDVAVTGVQTCALPILVRRDPYHRFFSCLVYVPRDRYNTEVRQRIEQIAREGFAGESVGSHAQISGSSHARVHVVVRTDPAQRHRADLAAIERRIAEAALTWADRLREVLAERRGEAAALALAGRYRQAFPLAYQDDVAPAEALADIDRLESLRQSPRVLQLNLHRPPGQRRERVHLKIVRLGDPVPISDVLPMLENFGLRVIAERPYELAWPEGGSAWIQDFELEHRDAVVIDIARIEANFREAFAAAWRDRKSTRLNSSHGYISYAVFCLKKKKRPTTIGAI